MRRNKFDIYADMLRLATNGIRKTHLVYQANLNFNMVERYLVKLAEMRYIYGKESKFPSKRGLVYTTTDEGREYLRRYDSLTDLGARTYPELAV